MHMVRCDEFYEKWRRCGNFCEKDPDTAAQIDAYLDQLQEIQEIAADCLSEEEFAAMAEIQISEKACRPVVSEKESEIRQDAAQHIVKTAEEKLMEEKKPRVTSNEVLRTVNKRRPSKFNSTNDNIEWAKRTWNPVVGCEHGCPYCYARDISNRFNPEKQFKPEFYPERLGAPKNTLVPPEAESNVGYRNVFVCSMADLFGDWVPKDWIDQVLSAVREAPQWNFLFLTKNPKRFIDIDWPRNAWVGTTVDRQRRVKAAEDAFRQIKAQVKFLSCEPLEEFVSFSDLSMFEWIIIGGRSQSLGKPEGQPEWRWVAHLIDQARQYGLKVYMKPNLRPERLREYPVAGGA
jgi:protein gp37